MALANYTELQTALIAWADSRGDTSDIIDDVVRLAESHFNLELRCRQMLTSTDLTPSSGAVTIPSDCVGIYSVIEKTSPRRVLDYYGKEALETNFDTTVSGNACGYTVVGSSLSMAPRPTNDIELTYYQEIPGLEANTTNWLMTKYPGLYLEACQMEIYRYLKMDADLQISAQRVEAMINELNASSDSAMLGNSGRKAVGPAF